MPEQIVLRPYQLESVEALRQGIRDGHRAQLLVAPTGAGKTVMAAHLLGEAQRRGSRASFVVDRVSLVDQTSMTLDRYGIDHGVVQAGHWRRRSSTPIQVCSAQTLEKRGFLPDTQLLIVDEAHCTRQQTTEFIRSGAAKVLGLTATPFTEGLSRLYTNVVNVTTTNKLIDEGYLVPLKVYAAKAIDMSGAKVVGGEWAEREIEERGTQIVGDIVNEWVDKTQKHFGGPAKTIVFSATVAHGDELCRQFQAAGFNFVQVSYKDGNDERRRQVIEEFRRPHSAIHGLVSCEALTKGFDVPDVLVGIAARPYRKSFSSHIQQLGRVMRTAPGKEFALWLDHCILEGTPVLTDRGLVPIEQVQATDRLWDGVEWVAHGGPIYKGVRDVISYAGLTATAEHLVSTPEGWRAFGEVAGEQGRILQTGLGWAAIRECDGRVARGVVAGATQPSGDSRPVRMRDLWLSVSDLAAQFADWADQGLRRLQSAGASVPSVASAQGRSDAIKVPQSSGQGVSQLRRAWHRVSVRFGSRGLSMDPRQPWDRGAASGAGPHRQRLALRTGKSALGHAAAEPHEPAKLGRLRRALARFSASLSRGAIRGRDAASAVLRPADERADRREVREAVPQAQGRVWDIRDAGPRNRFTAAGLLVHNCGNYLRFYDDQQSVFRDGVRGLEDGELDKKARKEPEEHEVKQLKCAGCGFVLPGGALTCPACGHARPMRQSLLEAVPGMMVEVDGAGVKPNGKPVPPWLSNRAAILAQLTYMGLEKKKGDVRAAESWVRANYRDLYLELPSRDWRLNSELAVEPSPALRTVVRQNFIKWIKKREAERAAA
ncbi:MAG: DEAD/DEAH box helicase family protein [Pseudomonadales bacterium]|nr:DEAD/DEAH box helicase family protein [Pseudomonadales bacterium]